MSTPNRVTFYDIGYDDSSRDWAVDGGDLSFVKTHEEILIQLLVDALETEVGATPPEVQRGWGFEGRTYNFGDLSDDRPKIKVKHYLLEMINGPLRPFIRPKTETLTFDFPGGNVFAATLVCVLTDYEATAFNHTFTWNGTTFRVQVT